VFGLVLEACVLDWHVLSCSLDVTIYANSFFKSIKI
jgi:hypothetical protein